tara:strand:- start:2455 stop:2724 length:270 start_codon:yes stop_codon:yes gene_type:complete
MNEYAIYLLEGIQPSPKEIAEMEYLSELDDTAEWLTEARILGLLTKVQGLLFAINKCNESLSTPTTRERLKILKEAIASIEEGMKEEEQ